MLELTHVYVLFRNSHLANDFNFNVNEPVRVEVEVYVNFATSLFAYKRKVTLCQISARMMVLILFLTLIQGQVLYFL